MDKKRKDGYVTGLVCLLLFSLFTYFTIISFSNSSAAIIMGIFATLFGGLGFGSLWKPESIGAIASQLLENLGKSEEQSDSHDKQIQKESSGIQAIADRGGQININVTQEKTQDKKMTEINSEAVDVANAAVKEEASQKNILLSAAQNITNLNITNDLLDKIYEQAFTQVNQLCHDAKLSDFSIIVRPFNEKNTEVSVNFHFYSKFANKIFAFRYSDGAPQVEHVLPDKYAKDQYDKIVFENLPWKECPQWMHFLGRAYTKIPSLSPVSSSYYTLSSHAFATPNWRARFYDGFTGNEPAYSWDGKGLGEDNIKEIN
jgi:hypothetical protein